MTFFNNATGNCSHLTAKWHNDTLLLYTNITWILVAKTRVAGEFPSSVLAIRQQIILSESECGQSESDSKCLETGCLSPGTALRSKVATQRLRMLHSQPVGDQPLQSVADCKKTHQAKTTTEVFCLFVFCRFKEVAILFLFCCDWDTKQSPENILSIYCFMLDSQEQQFNGFRDFFLL